MSLWPQSLSLDSSSIQCDLVNHGYGVPSQIDTPVLAALSRSLFHTEHKPCCIYLLLKIKTLNAINVSSILPLCIKMLSSILFFFSSYFIEAWKSSVMTTQLVTVCLQLTKDCCREKSLYQLSIKRKWFIKPLWVLGLLVGLKTQLEDVTVNVAMIKQLIDL